MSFTLQANPQTLLYRRVLKHNLTTPERILWFRLRNNQLGFKYRRQHGIGNYILDFYCPRLKLAIEIDGESHAGKQILKDATRDIL